DSINITVTAPQPPQIKGKVQTETEEQWWAILIIIVFIIIMIIVGFLMFKRKKAAEEAAKAEAVSPGVLIPEIVGGPVGEPLPAAPTVPIPLQIAPSVSSVPIPTLAPTPTVAPTSAPVLAGVQPGVTPSLPPAQPEEKEELSKAEKLKLIEERLAKSEISQESYEELKKNLEIEEAQPSVSVEPPAPTILAQPVPVPAPQLKTPVVPTMIKPEIAKVEQPPGKESTPLQPEVQPPLLEKPVEESKVEPPAVICPQCQSSAITTYPDGSFACSLCNYKWI
ncbi:MAG: hypothetical protein KAJ51_00060, partial [Thermoplasmata archaeon]|nr:hypothetical protein [Thermoplasmata archaeon]